MFSLVASNNNRGGDAWFCVGETSSFPNILDSGSVTLSEQMETSCKMVPGCKVFQVPKTDSSKSIEIKVEGGEGDEEEASGLQDQVLVFRYKGKVHAVDNKCPHASYPLSNGTPFDIEDFGAVLSAGLSCPKHDWSFDLFRGNGDRGNYKLKIWEVQLRKREDGTEEAWVRRKQRIG